MKKYLHIFAIAALLLTGCYDDLSEQKQQEIDTLKRETIAGIQEQIDSAAYALGTYKSLSEELSGYLDVLMEVSEALARDYEVLTTKLDEVKSAIQGEIDAAAARMLTEYENAKATLEGKINEINAVISAVQQKKDELNTRADALKKSLEEDYATIGWVEASFATLDWQMAISEDVFTIKSEVEELEASLEATERELFELLDNNIAEIESLSDESLRTAMEQLTQNYKDAIETATEGVRNAFSDSLGIAIRNSEAALHGWINERLDSCLTIAEAQGYINSFYTLVGANPNDPVDESYKSVQTRIEELQAALNETKEKLVTAYEEAIRKAIEESEGRMNTAITAEVDRINTEVGGYKGRVTTLETQVIELQSKVTELQGRISTVEEQITAINGSLEVLDSLYNAVQDYINTVKASLEANDVKDSTEVKGLIDALQTAADGIQAKINALKNYVGELPAGVTDDLTTWAAATMKTAEAQFDLYMKSQDISEYVEMIGDTLNLFSGRISADSIAVEGLVDRLQTAVDGWLNDTLKAYKTIAEIEAAILNDSVTLAGLITDEDEKINVQFNDLRDTYNQKVSAFIDEYTRALADAIENNKGKIDTTFINAVAKANSYIDGLQARVTQMDTDIAQLRDDIAFIKAAVAALKADISALEAFIDSTGYNSLQAFIDYVNGELANCPGTFARIGQVDTLRNIIYGTSDADTTGLKYWVNMMENLTARLGAAEDRTDSLDAFFAGFGAGETLQGELTKIYAALTDLKNEVYGTATKTGIKQLMADINAALASIQSSLDQLESDTKVTMFHSISYIPKNADASVSKGNVKLEFFVDPAPLAALIKVADCSVTNGTVSKVSGSNGVLTVEATGVGSGWIAVCVNVKSSLGTLEFISQYIRVK